MPELGEHAAFILAAYAVVIPVLVGLVIASLRRARSVRRALREVERDG